MSWIEKVKEQLIITTDDGKQYKPQYVNANKICEWNTATFDFIGLAGSYVSRKLPRGRKFNLDISFQGINHLDVAQALEDSTNTTTGPWQLSHPLYGSILVQPISIAFDNSLLNISLISVVVIETITLDKVNDVVISPSSFIATQGEQIRTQVLDELVNDVPQVSSALKSNMSTELKTQLNTISSSITNAADANNYINEFNKSTSLLNTVGSTTVDIARSVQRFTAMPYAFADTIENRLRICVTQFELLKSNAQNLFSRNSKKLLEFQMSSVMASALQATVTDANYDTTEDIENALDVIGQLEEDYIAILDGMSNTTVADDNSYIPNHESVRNVLYLCAYVHEHLVEIARNARVKYILTLLSDMTLFEVTAMVYGYDEKDENFHRIIADNNVSASEYLVLKKGRKITYYK